MLDFTICIAFSVQYPLVCIIILGKEAVSVSLSWVKDGGTLANRRMDAPLSDRITEIASFQCTKLNQAE